MKRFSTSKGFTLIELLIVIAILGVLAAGTLVAIDPVDKVNSANDSRVQNDVGILGRASESYAASHNGIYPFSTANLLSSGEVKIIPTAPSGYAAYGFAVPSGCTAELNAACTSVIVTGTLKSKKYTATPKQQYETSTGKVCQIAAATAACP